MNTSSPIAISGNQSKTMTLKEITDLLDVRHNYAMRVIDRWQELESTAQLKLPQTYVEALRALADESEAKQRALEIVEEQKQIIHGKDDLIKVSNEASIKAGEILVREFVKSCDIIDIGEKQFYHWMRDQKIVSERNEPYKKYRALGYFTWKPSEEKHGGEYRYTLRITPRGKVWLASKYMNYLEAQCSLPARNGLVLLEGGAA